ncbi:Molybdenum-containing formylmethanofuran dehydrogenase 1 subunit C [uncultured archaeon]|nr:Molybdenum-containing formylmethanofuran dehydrogenase 1 subunit C [uncultured archaeon]
MEPNTPDQKGLVIRDGLFRDTVGARNPTEKTVCLEGDAGMSTGILMQNGKVEVQGDAGQNTGVLMRGGRVVVHGSTGDFTGAEMRGGEVYVEGDAGSYACAKMRGGAVFARSAKAVPPVKAYPLDGDDLRKVSAIFSLNSFYAMMYKKYSPSK